jgi:hypothetical protein
MYFSLECEIKPPKTVAPLVEAIWQKLAPAGFDMNKLPYSIREVYVGGRLKGHELPLSHLPKSLNDLIDKAYGTIYSIAKVLEIGCEWEAYYPPPLH